MSNQELWWCHKCQCRMPKEHSHSTVESRWKKRREKRREEIRKQVRGE